MIATITKNKKPLDFDLEIFIESRGLIAAVKAVKNILICYTLEQAKEITDKTLKEIKESKRNRKND